MLTLTVFLTQAAPEGRLFGLDNQTVIQIAIQLFNAIVLAVALSVILYKPAKEFLRKRSDGIQSKINEAETAAAKANELIAEYERKLKAIDQEREKILEEARVKAYEESKQMLAEARQEASEIKKRAMESMAEEKSASKKKPAFILSKSLPRWLRNTWRKPSMMQCRNGFLRKPSLSWRKRNGETNGPQCRDAVGNL